MRKKAIYLIIFLFLTAFALAEEDVKNMIPLGITVKDASGNLLTGTYDFVFNISNSTDCSTPNILYSNATTQTTDASGWIVYNLTEVNISYKKQRWICFYRDGVLKYTLQVGKVPNAHFADEVKNVNNESINNTDDFSFGNIFLNEKITFNLGETIDNLIDGWIRITGGLMASKINDTTGQWGNVSINPPQIRGVDYFWRIINFTNELDNYLPSFWNLENSTSNSIKIVNGTIWNKIGSNITTSDAGDNFYLPNNLTVMGQVSIGTTTPSNQLEWTKNASGGNLSLLDTLFTDNIQSRTDNISFYNSDGSEKMRITDDGKVGIGTITPSHELNLIGTWNTTGDSVQGVLGVGTEAEWVGKNVGQGIVIGTKTAEVTITVTNAADNNAFVATDGTNTAFIRTGGNIGFGANTAWSLYSNNLQRQRLNADGSFIHNIGEVFDGHFTILDKDGGKLLFASASAKEIILVPVNGNVGIGTTTPTRKFHLIGSGNVSGDWAYGTLTSNSPHAILNYKNRDTGEFKKTQICMIADNGDLVMEYIHFNGLGYEKKYEKDNIECLSKKILESITPELDYLNVTTEVINSTLWDGTEINKTMIIQVGEYYNHKYVFNNSKEVDYKEYTAIKQKIALFKFKQIMPVK